MKLSEVSLAFALFISSLAAGLYIGYNIAPKQLRSTEPYSIKTDHITPAMLDFCHADSNCMDINVIK